ncbi:MAG: helix-turn-helix domain-containing protein [Sphingobium sp.]
MESAAKLEKIRNLCKTRLPGMYLRGGRVSLLCDRYTASEKVMTDMAVATQRGRGRPRDAEKDAMIREETWHLLAEKGYEGLTFEGLAERVGCSRATLYRRFPSKAALVAAIMDETSRSVEPHLPPGCSPRDALIAHATAAAVYLSGHRGLGVMRLGVALEKSTELDLVISAHAENERDFYRREFLRLHPTANAEDVNFACHSLIGSVTYHIAMIRQSLSDRRIHQLVDQAIALLGEPEQPLSRDRH